MGDIVRIGDQVSVAFQYASDVGLSSNSAQAVVADALAQNGLILTQYDNSQVGFFGGPATLTVRLQASDYGDKQDVAGHVAGIMYNQLGLSVYDARATGVARGFQSTIAGAGGSSTGIIGGAGGSSIPIVDGGVLAIVDIPITPEQVNPAPHTQDWLDKLAQQLGMSRSTLEVTGVALFALILVVSTRR